LPAHEPPLPVPLLRSERRSERRTGEEAARFMGTRHSGKSLSEALSNRFRLWHSTSWGSWQRFVESSMRLRDAPLPRPGSWGMLLGSSLPLRGSPLRRGASPLTPCGSSASSHDSREQRGASDLRDENLPKVAGPATRWGVNLAAHVPTRDHRR
jgi:hypothetical protein